MAPKTLAVDYGTKKIGLALSYATLAEPYGILVNSPAVFEEIAEICQKERVERLLVGISEGRSAENTLNFIARLKANIKLPIFTTDETLSTHQAGQQIKETRGKAYRGQDDHIAATNILQEWLDIQPDRT